MVESTTPLVLTYNEAPNIRRTLEKLTWARVILVMDSLSTDETLEIARSFPNVQVAQRPFGNHTAQWNFGLDLCRTDWVLALDADYVLPESFAKELAGLRPGEDVSAFYAKFRYCVFGRPLRGTLYPPRTVLFRKDRCRYVPDGHTQRLQVQGRTDFLRSVIDHDDRKSFSHWLWAQDRYAVLEGAKLAETPVSSLSRQDRLRHKVVFAPLLVFLYTLIGKGLILDGWPGWFYVFQRTLAEVILSLRLIEMKLEKQKTERGK
jgi:glycosyltransferase involved in cell wall biosynthesis